MTRAGYTLFATANVILVCALIALSPQAAAAAKAPPLPQSDYVVSPACSAPAPGQAACLALELQPSASASRARVHPPTSPSSPRTGLAKATECAGAYSATCVTPTGLRDAYFPGEAPEAPASEPQTIALVDAYNDPNAQTDLEVYEAEFGLSRCSATTSACFEKVNERGETTNLPFPVSEAARKAELSVCENIHVTTTTREAACKNVIEAEGWALETSTDIEVARAVCQTCRILLVEADSPNYPDLEVAEDTAAQHATEVSNSWGSEEPTSDSPAFNHPGIVITAASGDNGYLNWTEAGEAEEAEAHKEPTSYFAGADYPASSPHVVAVGGTRLTLSGSAWQSESVWNDDLGGATENYGASGSGCSLRLAAKTWQREVPDWATVGCGAHRAVADVSADADPYTGVAVYDSVPDFQAGEKEGEVVNEAPGWSPVGGTSVASPIIASMFAIAGGAHGAPYPAQTLYEHLDSSALHDVTSGGNGACDGNYSSGCGGSLNSPLDCGVGAWICNATSGYDGATGVGTPNGTDAFKPTEAPAKTNGSVPGEGSQGAGTGPIGGGSTTGGGSSPGSPGGGVTPGKTPAPVSAQAPPRILALTLTAKARVALRSLRLTVSGLGFSCTLSRIATVHVTLALQVHSAGHARWRSLADSLTFNAIKGVNHRRLRGQGQLAPGVYRLTLIPTGGAARSITIRVR